MAALSAKVGLTSTNSRHRIKKIRAVARLPDESIYAATQDLKDIGITGFAGVTQDPKQEDYAVATC